MSEGMMRLTPYRSNSTFTRPDYSKSKRAGDSPSLIQRVNVFHFWQASSPVWKNTARVLAVIFTAIVFLSAPSLGAALICVLPLGLLIGLAGIAFLWTGLIMSRMGTPELLATANTVRRGDVLGIVFRLPMKRDTDFPLIRIQLVLHEWVRYRCGTDTCTDQFDNVIDEQMYSGEKVRAGEELYKEVSFTIPADAMHTFNVSDNRLNWLIVVDLQIASFPDLKEKFEIEVMSEVNAA